MTTATSVSLRSIARGLPFDERKRRHNTAVIATHNQLLRAVVNAGIAGGEWRSSSHCAADEFALDDRTFRRWLSDTDLRLPAAVRAKLLDLAWAFGVEVRQRVSL